MYPSAIQKLIDLFSKFPTVGPRTAARFVFYLLKLPKEQVQNLISVISQLKKDIKICELCFNPFQGEDELCQICGNPSREKSLLCVLANETDLLSIEKTKKYHGLYFIFGGTIPASGKINLERLRIKDLEQRLKDHPEIKEIILALNPTTEGETTLLYLERLLKPFNKKVTKLARGLPLGGELEYADEETIASALEQRK